MIFDSIAGPVSDTPVFVLKAQQIYNYLMASF
jgi:hypothetical protein